MIYAWVNVQEDKRYCTALSPICSSSLWRNQATKVRCSLQIADDRSSEQLLSNKKRDKIIDLRAGPVIVISKTARYIPQESRANPDGRTGHLRPQANQLCTPLTSYALQTKWLWLQQTDQDRAGEPITYPDCSTGASLLQSFNLHSHWRRQDDSILGKSLDQWQVSLPACTMHLPPSAEKSPAEANCPRRTAKQKLGAKHQRGYVAAGDPGISPTLERGGRGAAQRSARPGSLAMDNRRKILSQISVHHVAPRFHPDVWPQTDLANLGATKGEDFPLARTQA